MKNQPSNFKSMTTLFQIPLIFFLLIFFGVANANTFAQGNTPSREAKKLYEEYCASCHSGGFKGWMTSAPEIGEIDEWKSFFDKGIEEMTHNVFTGEKKHEIKGECEDCSKEEIQATIEYIMLVTQ